MKFWIYYHVSDHPGWRELIDEKVTIMQAANMWQQAERIHFQLHYDPNSFSDWLGSAPYLNDPRVSIKLYHQQVKDTSFAPSFKPLGETYSMIDLHADVMALEEPRAIFRYSTKGITHRNDETWPVAVAWNDYIDYWNIGKWGLCLVALMAGFDTVGANWHAKDDPTGHWSGTVWWAHSDYIKRLPKLTLPHLVMFENQLGGFSPRHDAEVWIGYNGPKYLELNHYEHAVVYHVVPPKAENYLLAQDLANFKPIEPEAPKERCPDDPLLTRTWVS
jgi:hypothetical protein